MKPADEIWTNWNSEICDICSVWLVDMGCGDTKYIRADLMPQWQLVDENTPSDVELLLGWEGFGGKWETATDYWHSSRGKWYHGSATHWMPLPKPPA